MCGVDRDREADAERAHAALAVVPDSPVLQDDLTVRQHLELVTLSHGVDDDAVDERIASLLELLGLAARADFSRARVLLEHALLPAVVMTTAAALTVAGCALAGALPAPGVAALGLGAWKTKTREI